MAGNAQPAVLSPNPGHGTQPVNEVLAPGSQENPSAPKPTTPNGNWNPALPRTPLNAVAPNRKNVNDALQPGPYNHNRVEELGKYTGPLSKSGSETENLLEQYNHNTNGILIDGSDVDHDIPENMYRPENDDPQGWIHRDKLAKIESEELQAAGINLANTRRTLSKQGPRAVSRDGNAAEGSSKPESNTKTPREEKRQPVSSPVAEEDEGERKNWDLRTPEEIEEESDPVTQVYTNPVLRTPGSKIPVLTWSPLPKSQDRDTRPRKRTMSGNLSPDENTPETKMRPRRTSAGSQVLLDEGEALALTPSSGLRPPNRPSSPTKSKSIVTSSPSTSGGRKATPAGRKGSMRATASGSAGSPSQRPGTKSGDADRPRTAINRPEGDPPWLATMYKPDPRLPPDQQIIPTHARRQQQAQWMEEGAIPNIYDRDFTPISVHESMLNGGQNSQRQTTAKLPSEEKLPSHYSLINDQDQSSSAWPLKPSPVNSPRPGDVPSHSSSPAANPGVSGVAPSPSAGYSTMPKVPSPPIGSRSTSDRKHTGATGGMARDRGRPNRDEEKMEDDDKAEKGCGGCCIVM